MDGEQALQTCLPLSSKGNKGKDSESAATSVGKVFHLQVKDRIKVLKGPGGKRTAEGLLCFISTFQAAPVVGGLCQGRMSLFLRVKFATDNGLRVEDVSFQLQNRILEG